MSEIRDWTLPKCHIYNNFMILICNYYLYHFVNLHVSEPSATDFKFIICNLQHSKEIQSFLLQDWNNNIITVSIKACIILISELVQRAVFCRSLESRWHFTRKSQQQKRWASCWRNWRQTALQHHPALTIATHVLHWTPSLYNLSDAILLIVRHRSLWLSQADNSLYCLSPD